MAAYRNPRRSLIAAAGLLSLASIAGGPAAVAQGVARPAEALADRGEPRDQCTSVIADTLRALRQSRQTDDTAQKLNQLPYFERKEAACRAHLKIWNSLSPEQKAQAIAQGQADIQARVQQLASERKPVEPVPQSELGLGQGIDPDLLGKGFIAPDNSWDGYVDEQLMRAAGSAHVDNPSQGVLFIMEDGRIETARRYDTPSATGPVKITHEASGVLTLESVGGTYRAYHVPDGGVLNTVRVKGGTVYRFNLLTRKFE